MKSTVIDQHNKQAGFGKPVIVLFLLLILSFVAAAYCFIEANQQINRNHRLMDAVSDFGNTASGLVVDTMLPDPEDKISRGISLGNSILEKLSHGDTASRMPSVPQTLQADLDAVSSAWKNFVDGLKVSENTQADKETRAADPAELETLSSLSVSLGSWFEKISVSAEKRDAQKQFEALLQKLNENVLAAAPTPSEEQKLRSIDLWRQLREQLNMMAGAKDADAVVLLNEMHAEFTRLNPLFEAGRADAEVAQSTLASQYAKNSELQLLLDKLRDGAQVLEREHNYLFRLGVVAALFSLLFLFVLAIAFWRDSQNRIAQSDQKNALNQRAILRLLDEITDLAEGDLTARATVTEDITGAIADSVNYAIDTIRNLVITLNNTADQVASTAEDTTGTAMRLSRASNLQEREIRRSSNYITAMANTMRQMSEKANDARDVANQSVLRAQSGFTSVSETIEGMADIRQQIQDTSKRLKRLGESSQQIGEIISLVKDIAERTNLLALNSAIQASSKAGQGVSPLADEVQRLAERVDEATRDIEGLIVTIQADTRAAIASMELSTSGVVKGTSLAEQAGVLLNEIQLVSRELSEKIQTISDKSARQAEVTSKLSGNMRVISDIALQSNEGMKHTAESILELKDMSKELTRIVAGFNFSEEDTGFRRSKEDPIPEPDTEPDDDTEGLTLVSTIGREAGRDD